MTEIQKLGQILSRLYIENRKSKNMKLAVHHFAIKYANDLRNYGQEELKNMLIEFDVPITYYTEIQNMLKLSKYVSIKQDM
jgi:hypothetical protein